MKKEFIVLGSFIFLVVCVFMFNNRCSNNLETKVEQPEEEEVVKLNIEPEEMSLISKVYDDFNERTKVSYSGNAKKGNIYIAASYNINKNDIFKNRLPEPQADDFTICVVASHRGAKDVSRVELSINGGLYTLRPNFKKYEGAGKFTMIFNIASSLDNDFYPERISNAERAEARVVFDNGSETCELSKEDLKSISVIYKSYLIDGGKFQEPFRRHEESCHTYCSCFSYCRVYEQKRTAKSRYEGVSGSLS